MNVALLGASWKPERYSYQAMKLLAEKGYVVFPVNPLGGEIEGISVYQRLVAISEPIHTITVYLSAKNSTPLRDEVLQAKPNRVIFNPGAENPQMAAELRKNGIDVVEGCTLVMLKTNQF
ncbi:MAG: CoA-binding protein [Planctomycetota bacterium]